MADDRTELVRVDFKKFGADFKRICKCRNVGVRELARRLGMSKATISRVQYGQPCGVDKFFQLLWWMQKGPSSYVIVTADLKECLAEEIQH